MEEVDLTSPWLHSVLAVYFMAAHLSFILVFHKLGAGRIQIFSLLVTGWDKIGPECGSHTGRSVISQSHGAESMHVQLSKS